MNDQKQLWNSAHQEGEILHYSSQSTDFADEVIKKLKEPSRLLELGCGVGNDSRAFAKAGHTVLATDFSDVAIKKNSQRFSTITNLSFKTLDIGRSFKFGDNEFDAVYAHLSLHYFSDQITRKIFSEIRRILTSNGFLFFLCKSIHDPLYGKGIKIEKDMFELDGHVRHFFSEEYARSLMENNFMIEKIESGNEKFYGSTSSYVKAIARVVK